MEHIAYIGIGSNLDFPAQNCREAADFLDDHPAISIASRSSLYRSEPLGQTDQDWFVNSVVEVTTHLSAELLFKACLAIEQKMGRLRGDKWGPRIIDLDLLFFDDCVFKERGLEVPHPGIAERSFVLVPMHEIAPDFVHPKLKQTIEALLEAIPDPQEIHLLDSES